MPNDLAVVINFCTNDLRFFDPLAPFPKFCREKRTSYPNVKKLNREQVFKREIELEFGI